MTISKKDVQHVANLARLALDEDRIDLFAKQLGDILTYMDALNQVDTTGVPPTSHVIELTNAFRDDIPGRPSLREEMLANAPRAEDGQFVVPRVIS